MPEQVLMTIIIILIGVVSAILVYYLYRQKTIGSLWGAVIVAVFGAVAGNYFFSELQELIQNKINIAGTIVGAAILVKLLNLVSPRAYKE